MATERPTIRLTEYSHGAGCGCKLSPRVLDDILRGQTITRRHYPRLLVGNDTRDDAAVLDLGNGTGLVSTTDFFMPIVDDPYQFGRIASANAISDVYAMGAEPVLAIGILGWPIEKLSPDIAAEVVRGSRDLCDEAGIPLAGGHSIDAPEPIYGLAVNGLVELAYLKRNSTARAQDAVFLTKPLGIGIITTAHKRGIARTEDVETAIRWMTTLNRIGPELARTDGVTAMTDVTGFGLLGHLIEIARASRVRFRLVWNAVPTLPWVDAYIGMGALPGGTKRNWYSYGQDVLFDEPGKTPEEQQRLSLDQAWERYKQYIAILCDPQTSGGLLVCVDSEFDAAAEVADKLRSFRLAALAEPIAYGEGHTEQPPYVVVDLSGTSPLSETARL
ncbi:MAG: selenide, water dikinase SelD [Bacteroidota bacterium]|nr:selenide, water dikinase SelD [Candidatus Kapabacteria bacterium]MDW8075422.1 selenide, water dikinase SelD [Bacteroidota bacterium]